MLAMSIACMVMLIAQSDDATQIEWRNESDAFGKSYVSEVSWGQLAKSPSWEKNADNPPISPRRALSIAVREADRIKSPKGFRRTLHGLALVPVRDKWLWEVSFIWEVEVGGSTGIPNNFDVLILMDGSVVKPIVRSTPANTP